MRLILAAILVVGAGFIVAGCSSDDGDRYSAAEVELEKRIAAEEASRDAKLREVRKELRREKRRNGELL